MDDARDYQVDPSPPDEPEWMEIPEVLFSELLAACDPVPQVITAERRKQLERQKDAVTDVNRSLLVAMVEYFDGADLFCDHAVGICSCAAIAVHQELKLFLEGMLTCRACGGEGITWDEDRFKVEIAKIAAADGITEAQARDMCGEGPGFVQCETCGGNGIVRVKKEGK